MSKVLEETIQQKLEANRKLAEVRKKAEEEVARLEEKLKKKSAELDDANSNILKLEDDLVWAKKVAAKGGVPFSADEDNILANFLDQLDDPKRVNEPHDLEGGVYKVRLLVLLVVVKFFFVDN